MVTCAGSRDEELNSLGEIEILATMFSPEIMIQGKGVPSRLRPTEDFPASKHSEHHKTRSPPLVGILAFLGAGTPHNWKSPPILTLLSSPIMCPNTEAELPKAVQAMNAYTDSLNTQR